MPITSQQLFQLTTVRSLVIDCKKAATQPDVGREVERLLAWMKDQSRTTRLQVTLRFATANPFGRQIKTKLQALGCIVTMKTAY
jgi:hypothetical protein